MAQRADTIAPPSGGTHVPSPYLLFLGDVADPGFAKTALGLRDWARERCVGEWALPEATVTTGLPALSPMDAAARGARSMVIGVANKGGVIPPEWLPALEEALDAGLDLVGGMHERLADMPGLAVRAARLGRRLIDVRVPPPDMPVATGRKRSGKRLLTVGTDCALGKKYTALALARSFAGRGVATDFRATGQTGILIAGGGIPMDAVVADFAAGAAEHLSPDADHEHWDIIEGQGSLHHPAYAGVSLALLHGSQPDVIVVCHMAGREEMLGVPGYALPPVDEAAALAVMLGRRTNPAVRWGGVSLNTAALTDADAARLIANEAARLGRPVADPIRGGEAWDRLVDGCLGAA